MKRLFSANRVFLVGNSLRYLRYLADFNVYPISATWVDTGIAGFAADKMYVVQTLPKVIERCILMTTDPGDLVFDPTCGSGTTAFVAEQWGRRWITCDTSRVALAIARQRLLTAKFDYYTLADSEKGVMEGFKYKTVPHITLKSIAQNTALDPIFAEHEPILRQKLAELNHVLSAHNTPELRNALKIKLALKEKKDGKNSITDADRRRWLLPPDNRAAQQKQEAEAKKQGKPSPFTVPLDAPEWYAWEVPFDSDPDWPEALQIALTDYRTAWRAKMDAVNAAIAARAEQEPLVDQPAIERGKVRVCGPFTVEGVQPLPLSVDVETGDIIGGAPEELDTFDAANAPDQNEAESAAVAASRTAEGYLERMLRLLKADGVRFAENKVVHVTDLAPLSSGLLHASGHWTLGESERDVAVMFGPEYGPLTADMVEDAIHEARRGYDDLILAGFSFTAEAHALIADDPNPKLRLHSLLIRPDAAPTMDGLLKDPKESKKTDAAKKTNNQIFTVTGSPRVTLNSPDANGEYTVEMEGVDIYDPVNNAVITANATQVAAWFLDSDYDGYTFCITQAFFPDKSAWEKLSRDLSKVIDPDRFAAFSGTTSLPFPPGDHHRAAVKVIDPRGNEVMKIVRLQAEPVYVEHKNEY
jgi:adenine-specific DNA-methyltransferase